MTGRRLAGFVVAGLVVALLAAGVVSSFASSSPDGLERVAIDKQFDDTARDHRFAEGPFADYSARGVEHDRISTGLAGVIGVAITFAVGAGAVLVLRRLRPRVAADA